VCVHKLKAVQAVSLECGFEKTNRPHCNSDSTPSDCFTEIPVFEIKKVYVECECRFSSDTVTQIFCSGRKDKIPTSTCLEYHHSKLSGTSA